MTLFQSLATAAGYDPVKGPGSDCSAPDASGQCVLPWSGGTKAVSSVVLVANGVSFAVRKRLCLLICWNATSHDPLAIGHDPYLHDHWICGRLWLVRAVAAAYPHRDLLGCPVRQHVTDVYVPSHCSLPWSLGVLWEHALRSLQLRTDGASQWRSI